MLSSELHTDTSYAKPPFSNTEQLFLHYPHSIYSFWAKRPLISAKPLFERKNSFFANILSLCSIRS